jgi:hypothetical protein
MASITLRITDLHAFAAAAAAIDASVGADALRACIATLPGASPVTEVPIGSVQVLTVEHRRGSDQWAFLTLEAAQAQLHAYVSEYWAQEIDGEAMPADPGDAVERYFALVENEWSSIEHLDLGDADTVVVTTPGAVAYVSWGEWALKACERAGIRLEQATEDETRGRWDWLDGKQAASDTSFETIEDAAEDAIRARYQQDWRHEVENDDTTLGYRDWVDNRIELEREDEDDDGNGTEDDTGSVDTPTPAASGGASEPTIMAPGVEEALTAEYTAWLAQHPQFPETCALENFNAAQFKEIAATPEERQWLLDFIERWDAATAAWSDSRIDADDDAS